MVCHSKTRARACACFSLSLSLSRHSRAQVHNDTRKRPGKAASGQEQLGLTSKSAAGTLLRCAGGKASGGSGELRGNCWRRRQQLRAHGKRNQRGKARRQDPCKNQVQGLRL
eukprot:1992861-Amphidinium_carterae.1